MPIESKFAAGRRSQFDGEIFTTAPPLGQRHRRRLVELAGAAIAGHQLLDDRPGCQNIFPRFDALGAGTDNVDPRLFSKRLDQGGKVQQ